MEPKNPLYRYRPLRPLKFYEDFLNVEHLILEPNGESWADGVEHSKTFGDFILDRIKNTMPEWESYSPTMLRVMIVNYKQVLNIAVRGKTKHTKVLSFINAMIGSYVNQGVLTDPNIFDLEFIKEMGILQKEAWPKLAS